MEVPDTQSSKYCWTRVQIPNTKAAMPEQYETPATVHPATLDSMFQSLFVLVVPYLIKSVRISGVMPQGAGINFHLTRDLGRGCRAKSVTGAAWVIRLPEDDINAMAILFGHGPAASSSPAGHIHTPPHQTRAGRRFESCCRPGGPSYATVLQTQAGSRFEENSYI